MSNINDFVVVLTLAGLLLWELISGKAVGAWWRPIVTRQDNPGTYWFVVAVQSAILIVVLITGTKTWHFR